nr:MAG TPA: hypothetical protein [Crassvirales sp.]
MPKGNKKANRHSCLLPSCLEACQYRCSTLTFLMQKPE